MIEEYKSKIGVPEVYQRDGFGTPTHALNRNDASLCTISRAISRNLMKFTQKFQKLK
jgi:hypothetical protein